MPDTPRTRSLARLAFALLLAASASGCAYRTPPVRIPEAMPPVAPQARDAIDVTVDDRSKRPDREDTGKVREHAVEILSRAMAARKAGEGAARIRASVAIEERSGVLEAAYEDGLAVFALVFTPLGMVFEREKVSVSVVIETDKGAFEGRGSAEKMGSIYARARRRALAVAFSEALADASQAAKNAPLPAPKP